MQLLVLLMLLFRVGFSSNEQTPQSCLSYEPATVTLKGEINRKTFAGPPNYESIDDGDKPETYWILHLTNPICVDGNGSGRDDPDNQPEHNVFDIQLNLDEKQYDRYNDLLGKQVSVSGKLSHAFTGHHHTDVRLVEIIEIKGE
jgi:hypothetical protein